MKLLIVGNAVVVESDITKALIEKAYTYCPDALTTVDEDGNETFKIAAAYAGQEGSLSKYGIKFNGHSEQGNMQCTLVLPATGEKTIEVAKQLHGNALANFAAAEPVIIETINRHVGAVDQAFANATVIGTAPTQAEEEEAEA